MAVYFRFYRNTDYIRVSEFLIRHYQPENRDGNWLEPAWEYMHGHPDLDRSSLEKIGLWEDHGRIVAVVNFESRLGEAFFQFDPGYMHLRQEMLTYAEGSLRGISHEDGHRYLFAFINHRDVEFQSLVGTRGYHKESERNRSLSEFIVPDPFPPITLPDVFHLTSLAEESNWEKVHRVLWRGFNHEGEPSMNGGELEERRKMFDTPKSRRDLKIAVRAPDGSFVSFCGMFYEPANRYAYVEPVATDPAYRRLGLGKAAVLEGIRRCAALGATVAYVGSDQQFYLSLGFQVKSTSECWSKYW